MKTTDQVLKQFNTVINELDKLAEKHNKTATLIYKIAKKASEWQYKIVLLRDKYVAESTKAHFAAERIKKVIYG